MFKDSVRDYKERKERKEKEKKEQEMKEKENEKKYQKLNSLPDKPIQEDIINNFEGISNNEQPKIFNTTSKVENHIFPEYMNQINNNFKNNLDKGKKIYSSPFNGYQNHNKMNTETDNKINNNNLIK